MFLTGRDETVSLMEKDSEKNDFQTLSPWDKGETVKRDGNGAKGQSGTVWEQEILVIALKYYFWLVNFITSNPN